MKFANQFRIRCSAIHSIMADMKPDGLSENEAVELADLQLCEKGELLTEKGNVAKFTPNRKERLAELIDIKDNRKAELPTGAKTYCKQWTHDRCYKRRREVSTEQMEKGNRTENEGFELLKEYLDDEFMEEHPDRAIGEFIEGECDIKSPAILYDNKSAYTHETMPLLDEKVKREHWCQLQGYGFLYGYKRLARAYTLTNMPEDMIERKALFVTRAKYGPDFMEYEYREQLERLTKKYTYDDVPLALRVLITEFDFIPAFIEQVHDRVKMCRKYITTLEEQLIAEGKHPMYFEEPTQLTALQGAQQQKVA